MNFGVEKKSNLELVTGATKRDMFSSNEFFRESNKTE